MPRLKTFNAPGISPFRSSVRTQRTQASDFGGGGGFAAAGETLGQFAKQLDISQKKHDLTVAYGGLSDLNQSLSQLALDGQSGNVDGLDPAAPDYAKLMQVKVQNQIDTFTSGNSDFVQQSFASTLGALATSHFKGSLSYVAQRNIGNERIAMDKSVNTLADLVAAGAEPVEIQKQYQVMLNNSNLSANEKRTRVINSENFFQQTAIDVALQDPILAKRSLENGGFSYLSKTEKIKFGKQIDSAIVAQVKTMETKALVGIAMNNKGIWDKYITNSLTERDINLWDTSPRNKEIMKGLLPRAEKSKPPKVEDVVKFDTATRAASMFSRLGLGKNGAFVSGEDTAGQLKKVADFQNFLREQVANGKMTSRQVATYMKQTENVVQQNLAEQDLSWLQDLYNIAADNPIELTPVQKGINVIVRNANLQKNPELNSNALRKFFSAIEDPKNKDISPELLAQNASKEALSEQFGVPKETLIDSAFNAGQSNVVNQSSPVGPGVSFKQSNGKVYAVSQNGDVRVATQAEIAKLTAK